MMGFNMIKEFRVALCIVLLAMVGCKESGDNESSSEKDTQVENAKEAENDDPLATLPDTTVSEKLIGDYLELSFTTSVSTLEDEEESAVREAGCVRCGAKNTAKINVYESKIESYIETVELFIKETAGVHATNSTSIISQLNDHEEKWTDLFLTKVGGLYVGRDPGWPARLIADLNLGVKDNFEAMRLRLGSLAIVDLD